MTAWLFLLIASIMEMGWIFSLKFLSMDAIRKVSWSETYLKSALPLLGYIAFGLGNIYFFSLALKKIPMSTAFAIWTVTVLIGVKLVDTWILKEPSKASDYFFMFLALVAILGLKRN